MKSRLKVVIIYCMLMMSPSAFAGEALLGYVKGAEVLPKGRWEIEQDVTLRTDKGKGNYNAWNTETELEYGVTDRFEVDFALKTQSIDTEGLIIDGYLPKDESYGPRYSGAEFAMKYNFLSPAKDDFGVTGHLSFDYSSLDPHSGQNKDTYSLEMIVLLQKYFFDAQLIWMGNFGFESTYALRDPIDDLPPGFDWPTGPEMELEPSLGTGISYRFIPNWFIGAETLYETEFETEVGQERWSWFAGPSLHYSGKKWWATLTWLAQIKGGGEQYEDQEDADLHLIEKTKQETRVKVGFNF